MLNDLKNSRNIVNKQAWYINNNKMLDRYCIMYTALPTKPLADLYVEAAPLTGFHFIKLINYKIVAYLYTPANTEQCEQCLTENS